MNQNNKAENKKKIVLGILAHVDAGKTTLAEAMLYLGGQIRQVGRVDHGNAFLDNFALERERGITIFSKQAKFEWNDCEVVLLDTPGHVDFSAEMERTLQVLDYAVLVINGADGVQGHTRTLWRLLERYEIPVFLFVNKMDQPGTDGAKLMQELKKQLDENCVAFSELKYDDGADAEAGNRVALREDEELWDELATCDEELMNAYLEREKLEVDEIADAVAERKVFPCYFGAALHIQGVEALLDGMEKYAPSQLYEEKFGARVFKISRDASGNRLTHLKVTGGCLKVRMVVDNQESAASEDEVWQEKINQLRVYNGAGFEAVEEVAAGGICAVTGLSRTFAGQGLGAEPASELPMLEPVLNYRVELPEEADPVRVLGQLRQLEEEEPLLHIVWQESSKEIHAQVMGEVQIEILKNLILERFGLEVEFGTGSIVYKETIANRAIGIGHFEPLRHYAETQLLLEPGEPGSGLQFASLCSEDVLDKNWQRLIMTHLEERTHVGVLTGSPVTDLRVLLVGGRAHAKHTEGGDFRQATYRALRHGLRCAESVLLEPIFAFVLELPTEYLGRAMSDVQRMYGSFEPPVTEGDRSVLSGRAPVATFADYQREVNSYTHGEGHLSCILDGYEPCHNAEEVIENCGYDPEADLQNPTGSVFCAHGAGFVVDWDQVADYAHVELPAEVYRLLEAVEGKLDDTMMGVAGSQQSMSDAGTASRISQTKSSGEERYITHDEIEAIFRQTYGGHEQDKKRKRRYHVSRRDVYESQKKSAGQAAYSATSRYTKTGEKKEDCLLVDGYNIIFAWEELWELAKVNIDSARDRLMDIMCNYQGTLGGLLILVFDAYKVKGGPGSVLKYHNIHVVYTKEAETADQYIEKTVHEMASKYRITVATSDALEQRIVFGAGAMRMSAAGLLEAVESAAKELREEYMS
ncbi:MAG: GTP-binding protein [Lachnospiraceae bacterium]|nr:GTP-binding protein [Lachnospiraceae bacterium]